MKDFIGKKVIVRANGAGVFFGKLIEIENDNVVLKNARKLYYWSGACAVEQIAIDGVKNPENCKFTVFVEEIGIMKVLEIIPCTEKAINSISEVEEWKK